MYWNLTATKNSNKETSSTQVMELKANKNVHLVRLDWKQFNKDDILKAFSEVDTIIAAGKIFCVFSAIIHVIFLQNTFFEIKKVWLHLK